MPDPSSFQALLEASDNLCAIVDADYRYQWVNAAYHRLHAPSAASLSGLVMREIIGDEHFETITRPRLDRCLDGATQCFEAEHESDVLGKRDFEVRYIPLAHPVSGERQVGIVIADITHRRECERDLQKMMSIAHLNPSSIAITDLQGRIEYANPALEEISGYSRDELIGHTPAVLQSGNTSDDTYRNLWETIEAGRTWIGELENRRKDGSLYHEYTLITPLRNDDGEIINYATIKQDTTALRKTQSDLERSAFEDPLTGLYTRNGFSHALQGWVDQEGWRSEAIVMMVDIVGLRDINDAYGYEGGDRLLIDFSRRLLQQPHEGLTYSVFATPSLLKTDDEQGGSLLYGDLSDDDRLYRFLADLKPATTT